MADIPRQARIDPASKPGGQTPSHDTDPDNHRDQALRKLIRQRLTKLGISPGTAERIAGVPRDTIKSVLTARGESPRCIRAAITSVPHFQDHASDNWEPEGAGSDGVVNRSWSGRRSNMLSWSTCSIW